MIRCAQIQSQKVLTKVRDLVKEVFAWGMKRPVGTFLGGNLRHRCPSTLPWWGGCSALGSLKGSKLRHRGTAQTHLECMRVHRGRLDAPTREEKRPRSFRQSAQAGIHMEELLWVERDREGAGKGPWQWRGKEEGPGSSEGERGIPGAECAQGPAWS